MEAGNVVGTPCAHADFVDAPGRRDDQPQAVTYPLDLVTATIAAYNDHDLDGLAELHDPAARIEFAGVDGDIGLEAWLANLEVLFTILPDFTLRPLTVLADDHAAMIELNLSGTNSGEIPLTDGDRRFLGIDHDRLPATGRLVEATGVVVLRTGGGRVTRETHHWPRSWLDEGLGLVTVEVRPRPPDGQPGNGSGGAP